MIKQSAAIIGSTVLLLGAIAAAFVYIHVWPVPSQSIAPRSESMPHSTTQGDAISSPSTHFAIVASSSTIQIEHSITSMGSSTAPKVDWDIENAGADPVNGEPLNRVSVTINGRIYYVGIFDGNCGYANNDPTPLPENIIVEISCDYTEGGIGIGLFSDGDEIGVKARTYFFSDASPNSSIVDYTPYRSGPFHPIISVPKTDQIYRVSI